ncbi:restriction endonuclease subunit S [Pectobacterium parmentieri]|uniref:Restriction endonuclease subunit S n=1 Tax=Pectobacterium parmentieri TaxID=1905730 RepID=A0A0H3I430_PECPM|nr:restriction endonuclease subunit S [Pectobacterium parmentieri]AFI88600.1 Restriction modification system DNA specificity domain protein [Pectobacterium parmentieri]MBI0471768.1 restriction endonuclease subunit S [Pectobacterium parmentieri]MBI0494453.1 restriction endonuclease subunit S [Pectobacterium parmentieri]MBI0555742.1 restriction endonuclease subunit S [Pectobacterium parmentieri]MBI0568777.1 restriction endonuclease subunit S [Pectobacterium parmentieri]
MAKYKAYPEYRDSGVEWIDSIPSHWEVKPTFALCDASTKKNFGGAENNVLSLSYGNIIPRDVETNFGLLPESFNTYQIVDNRDLILRLTDLQNDKNSLRVGLAKQKGIITSAYLKLKAKDGVNPTFLYRLLHSYDTTKVFYGMGGGLRQSMKFEDFRRLPLLVPSKEEQLNISAFLDHETTKIDDLIEKQQQLIELLKEKRQAVISHAVTKGLDPNVPMKDSGVEWLGEVPEHWKIMKFSHCINIRSGQVDPRKSPYDNFWLIAPNHIASGQGRIINLETAKDQGADSGKYLCKNGEVIYSKIRPALVKACISPADNVLCSADMYPMSSNNGLTNNFLLLYLLSNVFTRFAVNQADRVAMPKINRESLADCKVPIPLESEQDKIYTHTTVTLNQLDVIIQKSEFTIKLLQERRTALISAAVTGKIDVRDWVAPANSEMADIEKSPEVNA